MAGRRGPYPGKRYPASYAGRDVGEGMVSQRSHRWHSFDWWYGHWGERDRCGAFRPDGSSEAVCWRDRGHRGRHRFGRVPKELLQAAAARRSQRGQTENARRGMDYRAYLEARLAQAERETRGVMLSAAGRRRGIDARRTWFSGRGATSSPYMSEELRDYFRAHGPNLSATQYRQHS
jgi:hypothetical protein